MPSKAFNDFIYSCFDTSFGAVHDGLNLEALLALEGEERDEAARLILEAIPKRIEDGRPTIAAAYLGLEEAVPLMRSGLASTQSLLPKIWLAWAIYRIDHDPLMASVILDILKKTDPDKGFIYWSDGLRCIIDFDLTPQILITLLELAAKVRPSILLTEKVERFFGQRSLSFFVSSDQWKPKGQEEMALRIWNELPTLERQRISGLLIARLNETRAPEIAGIMGLIRASDAAPIIRGMIPVSKGRDKVICALALYRIEQYEDAPIVCIGVLRSNESEDARMKAVEALMHIKATPESAMALLEALENDNDDWIRRCALVALGELFPEDQTISAISRNAGVDIWPTRDGWQQPSDEAMGTLRAAVEQAIIH